MSVLLLIFYQVVGTIAFLVALPYLLFRWARHPREMAERLGWGRTCPGQEGDPLWLHAASLGELGALRALWEDPARELTPPLLLTVLSVSARREAERRVPASIAVVHAPLDLWFAVIPFLRRQRPRGLIVTETELWPLTLALCRQRGIPVAWISGRLSRRKWKSTLTLKPVLRPLLRRIQGIGAQSAADAARFESLGADRVQVTGNLKYRMERRAEPLATAGAAHPDPPAPGSRFMLVAGSVRKGEEEVLEAVRLGGEEVPERPSLLMVLAPRHLREREHWVRACRARQIAFVPRSSLQLEPPAAALKDPHVRAAFRTAVDTALERSLKAEAGGDETRRPAVLLLDTHGELGLWYAAADAAFVGGTLAPLGGHNLFEPAREGAPVAFGPHTETVADLAEPLLRLGGGFVVQTGAELGAWVRRLMENPAERMAASAGALAAAAEVAGAVAKTWSFLACFPWTRVVPRRPRAPGEQDLHPEGERGP